MRFLQKLLLGGLLLTLFACGASNGDQQNPPAETAQASFRLSGDGYDQTMTFDSTNNLIFCRLGGDELWVRLARDQANDGERGPHIDIDICNFAGAGTYVPTDPRTRPCPEGLRWDIWWHDGGKIYHNAPTATPCQLVLTLEDGVLNGTFNCAEVMRFQGGGETMQILEGFFRCEVK